MPKFYITFGQTHVHRINGKTFDKDCIAEIETETEEEARILFHPQFCFFYSETKFREKLGNNMLDYFPRGVITL